MPAQSKEPDPDAMAMEAKKKAVIKIISVPAFLTMFGGCMLFSPRQAVAMKQFKDATDLTLFLARLASLGALFEFLVNPIFGKLADSYGRRPVLPLGNIATLLVRLILFAQPTKKWPLVIEQAVSIPIITSFFTTYRAAIADQLDGQAFAEANAIIGMAIGLALVGGPLAAKAIMNRMDPVYCYLAACFCSTLSLTHIYFIFKETLPLEKRRPLVLDDIQPLSFVQVLKKSRVLNRLMLITGMQTFTEGRNITDVINIYLQVQCKWNWAQINNFISAYGIALILSGVTVKPMMKALGLLKFTSFSNACNTLSMLSYARVPPLSMMVSLDVAMYLGMIFGAPGGRKRDAAEALIMKIGSTEGFGNGFLSAAMMNFRAVINILGPILFGSLYAFAQRKKYPQLVFIAGAVTILAAEASLHTLTPSELGLNEDGQPREAGNSAEAAKSKSTA